MSSCTVCALCQIYVVLLSYQMKGEMAGHGFRALVGKPKGKRHGGRPRSR
jgi:hypothetical protein